MTARRLGSLSISAIGLGCNNFGVRLDQAATDTVVSAALDSGINFFDTADVYGKTLSEGFLGRALGVQRKSVVIATKFGLKLDEQRPGGASPAYIRTAAEDSLRRLGTDYIDLYQVHRPDPEVPIEDTLGALADLVRAGKVREIGCSNFSAEQLRDADAKVGPAAPRFISVQNEYSLIERSIEDTVLRTSTALGLGVLPYFPLASGVLSGKYKKGQPPPPNTRLTKRESPLTERFLTDRNLATASSLADFAHARGRSLLELAFSWLLAHREVASVIAGASNALQVRANVASGNWTLTADELADIDRIAPRATAAS